MPGLVLTIGPTVSRSFSDAQAGGSDDTSRAAAACRAPVRRLWPASLDRLCMRSPGSWPASARPGEGQQVMPAHLPKQHRPCQQSAVALGGRERHRVDQLHVGRIWEGQSSGRRLAAPYRRGRFPERHPCPRRQLGPPEARTSAMGPSAAVKYRLAGSTPLAQHVETRPRSWIGCISTP